MLSSTTNKIESKQQKKTFEQFEFAKVVAYLDPANTKSEYLCVSVCLVCVCACVRSILHACVSVCAFLCGAHFSSVSVHSAGVVP